MRITQEVDYALRVISYLSKLGISKRIEAKIISEQENIPIRFLLKLLRKLVSHEIIKSYRGINGGYALNKFPKDISFYDIIVAIEGPIHVNKCLLDSMNCNLNRSSNCKLHKNLFEIQQNLVKDLKSRTFDLLI